MKRKIARVSELDEKNSTYTLSAYLIAQLGKNYSDGANEHITGEQLLQAAIDTVKELQYLAGGMVVFLEAENEEKLIKYFEIIIFNDLNVDENNINDVYNILKNIFRKL